MRNKGPEKKTPVILFLLFSLLTVGGIVYLKSLSETEAEGSLSSAENVEKLPIATPYTGSVSSEMQEHPETLMVALPDTIGKDKRPPYEAGYEDGYFNGMDDGSQNAERASYDDSNSFPSPEERTAYAKGYSEGYTKGFEDGRNGKQFNI
jgi:hypothetical protein